MINKLVLMTSLLFTSALLFTSCEKAVETIENQEEVTANLKNEGYTYLDIPTDYQAGSAAELTTFTLEETVFFEEEEHTVTIEIQLADQAIASIACNTDWVNTIGLPTDFMLSDEAIVDELHDIMEEAQQKAPKWWAKFKRWVSRAVGGCSGTVVTSNPVTGQCLETSAHRHWLTGDSYGGAGVPVDCGTASSWNYPC